MPTDIKALSPEVEAARLATAAQKQLEKDKQRNQEAQQRKRLEEEKRRELVRGDRTAHRLCQAMHGSVKALVEIYTILAVQSVAQLSNLIFVKNLPMLR